MVDFFGYALWALVNLFKNKLEFFPVNIKNILLIRTAYIGDVVMILPILKPLKELYPDSKITVLTSSKAKEALENNPYVDEILIYDAFWFYSRGVKKAIADYRRFLKLLRLKLYDLVIEARGDLRDIALLAYLSKSKYRISYNVGGGGYLLTHIVPFKEIKHKVEYHLDIIRFLGGEVKGVEWRIYLTPEEKNAGRLLLHDEGVRKSDFVVGIHPGGRLGLKCWFGYRYAEIADFIATR